MLQEFWECSSFPGRASSGSSLQVPPGSTLLWMGHLSCHGDPKIQNSPERCWTHAQCWGTKGRCVCNRRSASTSPSKVPSSGLPSAIRHCLITLTNKTQQSRWAGSLHPAPPAPGAMRGIHPFPNIVMGMSEHQVKGFFVASLGSSFFNVNHTPLYFEQSFIKSACESFSLNLKL